jgi:hypothetical protein
VRIVENAGMQNIQGTAAAIVPAVGWKLASESSIGENPYIKPAKTELVKLKIHLLLSI